MTLIYIRTKLPKWLKPHCVNLDTLNPDELYFVTGEKEIVSN